MAKATPIEKFANIIEITLEAYAEEIWSVTQSAIDTLGREAAKAVQANAKTAVHSRTYHKGWTYTAQRPKGHHRLEETGVVHNKTEYQLAHLLEKGHVTRNGTGRTYERTPAHPHIAEVEQMLIDKFEREIVKAIK